MSRASPLGVTDAARFSRRGACPALSSPMQTGDGLLVRLNPVASSLSPRQLTGLCAAAERHGNGIVEVTARGSFQIRGLTDSSAAALAVDVDALGITVRTGVPVQAGPLAGLDPDELADPRPLADRIRAGIESNGLNGRLGAKVSVAVDGGGRSGLDDVAADVRLAAVSPPRRPANADPLWMISIAGDAKTATELGLLSDDAAADAVMGVLHAIAALGRDARARDVLGEKHCAGATIGLFERQRSTLPPSGLPAISPSRGEIGGSAGCSSSCSTGDGRHIDDKADIGDWRNPSGRPISPPEGGEQPVREANSPCRWHDERSANAGTLRSSGDPAMAGRPEGGAKERDLAKVVSFGPARPGAPIPLRDGRLALSVALPFGQAEAHTLAHLAEAAEALDIDDLRLAPRRAIIALCPSHQAAEKWRTAASALGFVTDPADPRASISACPGAPACASGKMPARRIAALIAERTASRPDGSLSLHISGCAKGCAHPGAAALTLVGLESGVGLVANGTARDAPLAYATTDAAAAALARVASLVASQRRTGETGDACLDRLDAARVMDAFADKE